MNGDDLIRALGDINEEFVAEAEEWKRPGKQLWRRAGSLAACLCLILACMYGLYHRNILPEVPGAVGQLAAGGNIAIDEDAAIGETERNWEKPAKENKEPKPYAVSSRSIRTDGGAKDISYPFVTILRSREELEDYCLVQGRLFDLETGFLEACEAYDEIYFAEHDLILLCLEESSGSVTHQVTDVRDENGEWIITVTKHAPVEMIRDMPFDMTQWHILIEVQMGKVIAPESAVTVRFENKEN